MRILVGKVVCAVFLLSVVGGCPPPPKSFSFKYAEKRAVLDNGIKLVVVPDKTTEMVHVAVRYDVGSNQDPKGKAGIAHFAEHLMFQFRGEDMWGEKQKDGPAVWDVLPQLVTTMNAFTNWDTTHYYLEGPKEDWRKLLDLEARRMKAAMKCSPIPEDEFFRELEVVRNEIRWRMGDAENQVIIKLMKEAYPEGHPYREMIGGDDKQLESIKPADVCQFFKDYYMPQRATVIVVGNVDVEEAGETIKAYFGTIAKGDPKPLTPAKPVSLEHRVVNLEMDVERPQVSVVWGLPGIDDDEDDRDAASTMAGALAGRAIYFTRKWEVCADVDLGMLGGRKAPIFYFTCHLFKNGDADKALGYIWKAASGAHRGTNEIEYSKESKARAKSNMVEQLESLGTRATLLAELVQFEKRTDFGGTSEFILDELRRIDKLDEQNFENFIKKNMREEKAIVIKVKKVAGAGGQAERGEKQFSGDPHKERTPAINAADAFKQEPYPKSNSILDSAERYELPNGMKVVLLPTSSMPLVHAQLVFSAGSAHEPPEMAGLARIAAGYLENIDGAMALGQLGAYVGGQAGMDFSTFYGRGMEIYLDQVLHGLERHVAIGDYDQEQIESWHKGYKQRQQLESYRAEEAFYMEMAKILYGPEHRYTLTGGATTKTFEKIGRDVAYDYRKKHYVAKNGTLILVGSFNKVEAKASIEKYFGDISSGKADLPVTEPHAPRDGAVYLGVATRQSPQTLVSIVYPAPAGMDGNHAARMILGSMLNERMGKIRTKLGSTYGTRASRRTMVGPTSYDMGGMVDSARVAESVKAMREEIDSLKTNETIFNTDFVKARRVLVKQLLAESTETWALASKLSTIAQYNLPADYYDKLIKQVATMSTAQVRAVLNEEIVPEKEIIGILSDKDNLVKTFKELGLKATIIEP